VTIFISAEHAFIKWDEGDPVDWATPDRVWNLAHDFCGNCGLDVPGCGCPRDPHHPDHPLGWPPHGRAFILTFAPGMEVLTANDRVHRYAAAKVTKQLRADAQNLAFIRKMPPLERARIVLEYGNPPRRRRDRHPLASARVEDSDALYPTRKALVDGLADAKVLPRGDGRRRVGEAVCRFMQGTWPRGQVRLVITELWAGES
jgi:hypothetical protein